MVNIEEIVVSMVTFLLLFIIYNKCSKKGQIILLGIVAVMIFIFLFIYGLKLGFPNLLNMLVR